jgi:hypothetical protein
MIDAIAIKDQKFEVFYERFIKEFPVLNIEGLKPFVLLTYSQGFLDGSESMVAHIKDELN